MGYQMNAQQGERLIAALNGESFDPPGPYDNTANQTPVTAEQGERLIAAAESGSGAVSSVNGQTGDVVLGAEDVGALPDTTTIPSALADLSADATHRTVTDTEKASWNGLQSQIDAITAQSDVVDVVGTYAELQAYSKPLYFDDIVKVLDDSTHNNARSYYRWKGEDDGWFYIGSEAISYTKAETDTLLSGKQDALGFTPYNSTNPAGYQTSAQVETAITGKGYQTSAQVESAITAAIGNAIGGAY